MTTHPPESTDDSSAIPAGSSSDSDYEDHLRAIAEHMPGVVYSYDLEPDGSRSIVYLGPGLGDLIGPKAAKKVSTDFNSLFDRLHPDDRTRLRHAVGTGAQRERHLDFELRLLHDDGEYRWIRSLSNGVRRRHGVVRWYVILIDIGEKKDIEERNRLLVDLAPLGIYFGSNGKIEFANRAFAHMVGCEDPTDLCGRRVLDFVHPSLHAQIAKHVNEFDAGKRESQLTEEIYIRLDGSHVPVEAIGTRFTFQGKRYGMVIVRDISERKLAVERLRESEHRYRLLAQSRQLLLHELNHRVKNHLAGLLSLIDMMQRERGPTTEVFDALRNRLFGMAVVHDIIAARGWKSIELSSLVRQIMTGSKDSEERDTPFTIKGDEILVTPRQAGPIAMVVQELLVNSRKHGALKVPAGRVHIEWDAEPTRSESAHDGMSVNLKWIERGGPPPSPEVEPGLGMRLINGFSQFELNGRSDFQFDKEGLEFQLAMSLSQSDDPIRGSLPEDSIAPVDESASPRP